MNHCLATAVPPSVQGLQPFIPMFAPQLVALFALVMASDAIQCNVQNSVQGYTIQTCPANIYQCLKFTCTVGGGGQQISKGCNDPGNPATACSTLTANCAQQGGQGQCYTCSNYDLCNAASGMMTLASLVGFLSFYYFTM